MRLTGHKDKEMIQVTIMRRLGSKSFKGSKSFSVEDTTVEALFDFLVKTISAEEKKNDRGQEKK